LDSQYPRASSYLRADWRLLLLLGIAIAAVIGLSLAKPIWQPPAYHAFADARTFLGIPNALNVLSNLPFTVVGLVGIFLLRPGGRLAMPSPLQTAYLVVSTGVFFTGFGSAYYHWTPTNGTLLWDRLPMAVAFMGLFAAVLGERVGLKIARRLLWPLVAFGLASVLYWHWKDDLRLYVLTQFYPLLTIPILVALFPPMYTRGADFFGALGLYVVAKVLEEADVAIFKLTAGVVSGHTLKHLAAALGAWWVLRMLCLRRPIATVTE
jgi:hypothetical protein